jgi:hypothetical protein
VRWWNIGNRYKCKVFNHYNAKQVLIGIANLMHHWNCHFTAGAFYCSLITDNCFFVCISIFKFNIFSIKGSFFCSVYTNNHFKCGSVWLCYVEIFCVDCNIALHKVLLAWILLNFFFFVWIALQKVLSILYTVFSYVFISMLTWAWLFNRHYYCLDCFSFRLKIILWTFR